MIIFAENQPITFEHIDAVKEMADKVKRIRELHKPDEEYSNECHHCTELLRRTGYVEYPCPTIQALDGEQK